MTMHTGGRGDYSESSVLLIKMILGGIIGAFVGYTFGFVGLAGMVIGIAWARAVFLWD